MVQINASLNQTKSQAMKLGCLILAGLFCAIGSAKLEDKDVFDKMVLDPNLKTFVSLIVKADMVEALKAEGPITVFAPNNGAFAKIPTATLEKLMKEKASLKKFIQLHIFPTKVMTKDLKDGPMKSSSGEVIPVKIKLPLPITVGGAKFITSDLETSNGVFHVIGSVMIPSVKAVKTL